MFSHLVHNGTQIVMIVMIQADLIMTIVMTRYQRSILFKRANKKPLPNLPGKGLLSIKIKKLLCYIEFTNADQFLLTIIGIVHI